MMNSNTDRSITRRQALAAAATTVAAAGLHLAACG